MVSPLASSSPNPLSVRIKDVDEEHAETTPANFLKQLSPCSSHPVLHVVPSFESTSTARVPRDSMPTPGSSATQPFETSLRGIQASFDVFQMHNDPYVGEDGGVLDLPPRAIAGIHLVMMICVSFSGDYPQSSSLQSDAKRVPCDYVHPQIPLAPRHIQHSLRS